MNWKHLNYDLLNVIIEVKQWYFFKVEERDKEIDRLNRALHGGRPHDVISLESQNISNEKLIAHLNLQASIFTLTYECLNITEGLTCVLTVNFCSLIQIEYLQETNRTLEQKVEGLQQKKKDASTEVANLSLKNRELCEELTHIDDLAKRMEMDKEFVLETADMELQEAKVRIWENGK